MLPVGLPAGENIDVTVWVGTAQPDVDVGWEVDEGGAIVAPITISAQHQETWYRPGIGGASTVYLYSAAGASAVVVIEDPS